MTEQPQIEVGGDILSSAGAGQFGSTGYCDRGGNIVIAPGTRVRLWYHQSGLASALTATK
jgi:predicted GNAT family acetyltransferase